MEKTNKLTTKKLIWILMTVFILAFGAIGALAYARFAVQKVAAEEEYKYVNPDETKAETDEGITIDGILDEEQYKNNNWLYLYNENEGATVDIAMTSYYGEKGMYFVFDVTESSPIYVNLDRISYLNSGIEMYLAPNGVTNMNTNSMFEIDMMPTGDMSFKQRDGKGSFIDVLSSNDIMAYLGATTKGGEVNTTECYGYNLELFIPWEYMDWLGVDSSSMKDDFVYVNPAHITSYDPEGTDANEDRFWCSFAKQLGGDGWNNVEKYFRFNRAGVIGTEPITIEKQEHCEVIGADSIIPGLKSRITIIPEDGYALNSILVNGEEYIKKVSYNEDGSVTLVLKGVEGGLKISVSAELVTDGNKTLSGTVYVNKIDGDTLDGVAISYKGPKGEKEILLDKKGHFELKDLEQGYYKITVMKEGYPKLIRGILLNRDIDTELTLEYPTFQIVSGYCWDLDEQNDGIIRKTDGRGVILTNDSYKKFSLEAKFRYDDTLAKVDDGDDYVQQRMGLRIKFDNEKYWHINVVQQDGQYMVQYGKITEDASIFNWTKVYLMSNEDIAKYKSKDGIALKVVRDGQYANVYLGGKLIAIEDLGSEYKNRKAQIGMESFVSNTDRMTIPYDISTRNINVIKEGIFARGGSWDISKQFEGLITLNYGGYGAIPFQKQYQDMDLTVWIKDDAKGVDKETEDSPRTDVRFVFDNEKEVTFGIVQSKDGKVIVQSMKETNALTGWATHYTLSEEEIAQYKTETGIPLRIVRMGTEFTIYLNGKMIKILDFEGKIAADTNATIYIRHWGDEGVDIDIPFKMKTDLDTVDIQTKDDGNGKVKTHKKAYVLGDTVVISGEGNEGYYCSKLKLDGKEVTRQLNGTYAFTAEKEKYEVEAVFAKRVFKDSASWNLFEQNEGIVYKPNGGYGSIEFYKQYQDIDLRLNVKNDANGTEDPRTDVKFAFDNGKVITFGVIQNSDGSVIVQSMKEDNALTGWTTHYTFTEEEKAQYLTEEGIPFRIVRIGTEFTLFVGDKMAKFCDLTGKIEADTKATVYIRHWGDAGADIAIPFEVKTEFDFVTIDTKDDGNGKVKTNKKAYVLGDTVVVSGEGNEGYYCSELKVDGNEVTRQLNGTYAFTAEKDNYEVEAVFAKKVFKDNTSWNLFEQNEGIVYKPNGGWGEIQFVETYADMDLKVWLKAYNHDARSAVYVKFDNNKSLTFSLYNENGNGRIDIMDDGSNHLHVKWNLYRLTDEENVKMKSTDANEKGVELRVVRIGTTFSLYLEGREVYTGDFNGQIGETDKAKVYIRHWGDAGTDIAIPFEVKTEFDFVTIDTKDDGNGKVKTNKKAYVLGDTVVVSGEGNEGYYCTEIKVDGKAVALSSDGTYKFTATKAKYEVEGIFAKQVFNDSNGWDLSRQDEGLAVKTGGGWGEIQSVNSYENVDFHMWIKGQTNNSGAGARITFSNDKSFTFRVFHENGAGKVQLMDDSGKQLVVNWGLKTLGDAAKAKLISGDATVKGVEARFVRVGTTLYLYVEDELLYSNNFSGQISETDTATIKVMHWGDGGKNIEIPFSITDDVESKITVKEVSHGTLVADKTKCKHGETVTLTTTPAAGYYCTGIKVDGTEVTGAGTYSFSATKSTHEVEGVFAKKVFNDSNGWDLSRQDEGLVVKTNGGWGEIQFIETYADMDLKVWMKAYNHDARGAVKLLFDNNKSLTFSLYNENGNGRIDIMDDGSNHLYCKWNLCRLTDAENAKMKSTDANEKGVELRIVRVGTTFYLYLEGKQVYSGDFNGQIGATDKMKVSIRHWGDGGKNVGFPFEITKGIFEYNTAWNLTKQFDGTIVKTGGGWGEVQFSESYADLDLRVWMKAYKHDARGAVKILFGNNKSLTFSLYNENGNGRIDIMDDGNNHLYCKWNLCRLTNEENTKMKSTDANEKGVELRIVRVGTTFYLYLEGKPVYSGDFNGQIGATDKAKIYIRHWGDNGVDKEMKFQLSTPAQVLSSIQRTYMETRNKWNLLKFAIMGV